ncbi:methylthioribulose 1-phosphate dehydratase [Microbacterium sp. APC 3898]|jgi:methylthioribulose-1-phosphate dehydratase|uniref:Methylthioribulose-1-phosphate dehydratase n=2 Tax=Planococcus TaxID=1372 RepID=A0ABT7ZJD6_9BACL|nr:MULTISPECIES: methylthioribulose 1-phosphate dehydratase [Terrabacteria group]MBF6633902.1 methylthioribulose 1-phosphate dehydratase [Planococcus sp. (in: firmicutes)]MBD8014372.1 methylthioribulose 1-phosphate dehydratase [Planococcus wigleyi]MDN3427226.1 methylthioribulose 1-phosphate dehydratase [Planococcus sp. APC 4016]MDN3436571.1 methylthioribulose 1-phosphate dehydratase [Planococcus sp. APC 3900]MDN3499507.1 methylthioribulose 1-phosphate dehydratase [Microbacterium sp. APC 3898]
MTALHDKWLELADVKDELAIRDWFMGTSGNLAIKVADEPLEFLVTASGKDKKKRTDEDFLLVDADGQPAAGTLLKPSAETLLHCAIYGKTGAGCSLHVHTVANNVISELYGDAGKIDFQGQELIKAFGLWEEDAVLTIPIIPNHADIPTLAAAFEPYITADKGAVLIRNHGITVWGKDGFEAKKLLEASEFLFQYQLALQLQLK